MEYNEVVSTFSKLVETHFLQRCPPVSEVVAPVSAAPVVPGGPAAPASTGPPAPESFSDCYTVPSVSLVGRGKRRRSGEDAAADQGTAKKTKTDLQVGGGGC